MSDANKRVLQSYSRGNILLAGGGLDVNTRKIAVGLNYQASISQNIARGEIQAKPRLSAHVSFIL
jgi:hypothetical protein